jgi:hypothetical protein
MMKKKRKGKKRPNAEKTEAPRNLSPAELDRVRRWHRTDVPFFAVGFSGWARPSTIMKRLEQPGSTVDGILQLEPLWYGQKEGDLTCGALGLFHFLHDLHQAINANMSGPMLDSYGL